MILHTPSLRRNRSGFTLIEVSLAILVLGLGLMAAFGLFPAGVRQNEESTADTRAALFADYVLNGMQANAATITEWNEWKAEANGNFQNSQILGNGSGMPLPCPNTSLAGVQNGVTPPVWPNWPTASDNKLRYQLTMDVVANSSNRVYTAILQVKDLDDGSDFNPPDGTFYAAFVFKGM